MLIIGLFPKACNMWQTVDNTVKAAASNSGFLVKNAAEIGDQCDCGVWTYRLKIADASNGSVFMWDFYGEGLKLLTTLETYIFGN